jgi:uncharacterized damage-inducible protein DinB
VSERARALAERYEQANGDLIAEVERSSGGAWGKQCSNEGWSVAVTAHHVAIQTAPVAGIVHAIATGQPLPPITMEMIHQGNEEHAAQYANCTQAETAELLRTSGADAARMVRGLTDEQLDRSAELSLLGGASMSAQQFAENILIGHVEGHLASIRQAVSA